MTFEPKRFVGSIITGGDIMPLRFDASADEDGRLKIEPLPLDTLSVCKLQAMMGKPGAYSKSLELKGTAEDNSTFFSDTVELSGSRLGTNGNSISLKAQSATVEVDIKTPVKAPIMRLWFRGFESYRTQPVNTSLGTVQVGGPIKATSQDEMAGCVAVQAPEEVIVANWVKKADELLTFMHQGLGFAHGGRLQTPRLDVIIGSRWKAILYDGTGFSKSLAPIHRMNQGPFIEALAKRFDDPTPFPDMLWTAVSWLNSFNPFDEARYLMAMTALAGC